MDIDIINKTLLNTVDDDGVDGSDISYRFLVRVLTAANVALEDSIAEESEINQALRNLAENLLNILDEEWVKWKILIMTS